MNVLVDGNGNRGGRGCSASVKAILRKMIDLDFHMGLALKIIEWALLFCILISAKKLTKQSFMGCRRSFRTHKREITRYFQPLNIEPMYLYNFFFLFEFRLCLMIYLDFVYKFFKNYI